MGFFGFGKKKRTAASEADSAGDATAAEDSAVAAQEAAETADVVSEDSDAAQAPEATPHGPWDVDEIPEDEKYLDLGGFRLPARQNIQLRLQVNQEKTSVVGVTVTYKDSSLELAGFAAPKSKGLWKDISAELMKGNADGTLIDGYFGTEISMSVVVGSKKVPTRIVGVDGPRWMLRGIFTGKAAVKGEQKDTLDDFFAAIVVDRGDEPLAPRDPLPLHPPIQMSDEDSDADTDDETPEVPGKPKGPLTPIQNTEVQQTLSRGPMFSEIR
ncbi:MAG: DUF3710 domain-containing protein [Bifidobacteriaceae bacterium]|nr:DUF3710 domain-containing protein [Bifidobacteriaceae bacterium]